MIKDQTATEAQHTQHTNQSAFFFLQKLLSVCVNTESTSWIFQKKLGTLDSMLETINVRLHGVNQSLGLHQICFWHKSSLTHARQLSKVLSECVQESVASVHVVLCRGHLQVEVLHKLSFVFHLTQRIRQISQQFGQGT